MNANATAKRRWPTVLLVVSLAVNLLLVGFLFGSEHRLRGGERAMGPPHSQVGRFLRGTDEARRNELAPLARTYWQDSRRSMKQLRKARSALNTALSAQPLDETQIEQAMSAVDNALLHSSQVSQRAMLPLIKALQPAERARLAASGRRAPGERARARHRMGRAADPAPGPP
ncbi:MAG: periplasmic heavy metal sensor [Pseudomonadales bacterium]